MKFFSNSKSRLKAAPRSSLSQPKGEKAIVNEQLFHQLFDSCQDIHIEEIHLGATSNHFVALIIYCEGLCDTKLLYQSVLPTLHHIFLASPPQNKAELENIKTFPMKLLDREIDPNKIIHEVFQGELLFFFKNFEAFYSFNLSQPPQRSPEEPNNEVSFRGARDGFIEELSTNVALIRKRMKTTSLHYEQFTLGTRTQTKVGLLFVQDIIQEDVIAEIRSRLSCIEIDEMISSSQLEEMLVDNPFPLFPSFNYTGRPDFAVESLLSGRFVLLVNGSPTAIIAPTTLSSFFKSVEDSNTFFLFVAFERMLRWLGLVIALFVPGFWIALVTFHQDQIPFTMVATLVISRQGVPVPPPLEAFLMLLLFEIFREAGARLPSVVGQTLSVVGGLIIGQAAISAGLTAPSILVIVATSVVSQFTLINQNLTGTISILRFMVLLMASTFGMFGFLIALFGIIVYLSNLRSFGIPFMAPLSPPSWRDIKQAIFSVPWNSRKQRPEHLHPQDPTRKRGNS